MIDKPMGSYPSSQFTSPQKVRKEGFWEKNLGKLEANSAPRVKRQAITAFSLPKTFVLTRKHLLLEGILLGRGKMLMMFLASTRAPAEGVN